MSKLIEEGMENKRRRRRGRWTIGRRMAEGRRVNDILCTLPLNDSQHTTIDHDFITISPSRSRSKTCEKEKEISS